MAELKNYHTIRYGQADGEIKFGHLTQDNTLSSVLLRNGKAKNHYITLDSSGAPHRKYGTICRSPGSFQVRAGDNVDKDVPGVYVEAVSGDLVLRAPSGRVRIEGVNIDLIASGPDGQNGVITLDANEKVLMRAQIIDASSKVSTRLFSEKTVEVIGNAILNMYGGFVDIADGATAIKGSILPSTCELQNKPTLL
tara:strand:- start:1812 stop:2396 length:585 start_codon:yes stop_codon:yes gene_type:complete